jgi:hypothetical protein
MEISGNHQSTLNRRTRRTRRGRAGSAGTAGQHCRARKAAFESESCGITHERAVPLTLLEKGNPSNVQNELTRNGRILFSLRNLIAGCADHSCRGRIGDCRVDRPGPRRVEVLWHAGLTVEITTESGGRRKRLRNASKNERRSKSRTFTRESMLMEIAGNYQSTLNRRTRRTRSGRAGSAGTAGQRQPRWDLDRRLVSGIGGGSGSKSKSKSRSRTQAGPPCAPAAHRRTPTSAVRRRPRARWEGETGRLRLRLRAGLERAHRRRSAGPPHAGGRGARETAIYTGIQMLEGSQSSATHCHAFETSGGRRRRNVSRHIFNFYRGIRIGMKGIRGTKSGMACRRATCHCKSGPLYTMSNRCLGAHAPSYMMSALRGSGGG